MISFLKSPGSNLVFGCLFALAVNAEAAPVAGVDFSSGGSFNSSTDDLVAGDGITVSGWSFAGGGGIVSDSNADAGRASAPVGKFNGPSTTGTPPVVGSTPPTQGVHSFTILIDPGTTINLANVSFDFSRATGSGNQRWLAFRTSLDSALIYSENGPARSTLESVSLDLTDAKYQGLSNESVTFYWYSGGEGSGDCDIDSIVIDAEIAAAGPPTVANAAATQIEATSVTLNGVVTDTGGASPLVTIFYGSTNGGTNPANWTNSVPLGNESGSFSTPVTGLAPATNYFFRAFAENNGGSDWADSSSSVTTAEVFSPAIEASPAMNITGTAARLEGAVTDTGGDAPVVTLFWGENDAGTSAGSWDNSLNLGFQAGSFETTLTELDPLTGYFFRFRAVNASGTEWTSPTSNFITLEVRDLAINEFMAANDGGQTNNPNGWYPIAGQVSGRTDDWIEIINRSNAELPLDGWFLTDDASELNKWAFPDGTIVPAKGFVIVYASGDDVPDANGNLHTNFKLSSGGEYLALADPLLEVASEFGPGGSDFSDQDDDVSYGLHPETGLSVYFGAPTPGGDNDAAGQAQVADTKFNIGRGYYQTAIDVAITSATPDAVIYYTTDGSLPIDEEGNPGPTALIYGAPINVSQTTAIRAGAVKDGLTPTNVDCNTYVLLDIENAAANGVDPAGLNTPFLQQVQPAGWGNLSSGDFNMDPRVSQSTATASGLQASTARTMLEGMRDIPTVSIVMNRDDFSGGNGIYSNSTNKGFAWERACSAEFIPAANDERDDWQENCGLRVQGGASRNPSSSPKHSLSFRFRERYGAAKLREDLFPGSDVNEFDVIALRAGYNNSWIHRDAGQRGRGSMIRDQWMRQSMLDMGHSSAGEGFMCHIFVNGLYWGVHNLCERGDASHYAEHNGGDADSLDARNGSEFVDGNSTAWNQIDNVVDTGDWEKIQQVIDIDQYIDYQLINRFGSNQDLKTSGNWRAAGGGPFSPGQPEQMAFWELYSWDGERTLESQTTNFVPLDPMGVRDELESNPEYRLRLADRVEKHFNGDGALTATETEGRWRRFADDLDRAIIAESARWGDHRRSSLPYTRDSEWLAEQSRLYNVYFPVRTDNVLNNLSLPSIDAPAYLVGGVAQREGVIPSGSALTATANGTILYTTDGSDPRLEGGAVSPNATSIASGDVIPLTAGAVIKARARLGATWSALSGGTFLVGPIADSTNIVVSEFMYNPPGMEEDAEFIELMNVHPTDDVDLSQVTFDGISYTFPLGVSLPVGERIVIVKNQTVFATIYDTAAIRIAPGNYSSSLSNDGEEIVVINTLGVDVQRFTYNDVPPWPAEADGDGYTLTLIAPEGSPDHNVPQNWRISVLPGGSPSASDATMFQGDPLADLDGDGLTALAEYAFGTIDGDANSSLEAELEISSEDFDDGHGGMAEYLTFSYRRNLAADDIEFAVVVSEDLVDWQNDQTEFVRSSANGDGTEKVTVRTLAPVSDYEKRFIRVNVSTWP